MSKSSLPTQPDPRRFVIPISWKLLGATAVVGAVAAAIAVIGLKRIQTVNENLTRTVEFLATNVKLAALVKEDLITVTRAERNMILAQTEDGMQRFATVVDEVSEALQDRLPLLQAVVNEDERRQLLVFTEKWQSWRQNHADVRRFTAMDSDIQSRNISVGESQQAVDRLMSALTAIAGRCRDDLESARQAADVERCAAAAEKLSLVAAVSSSALAMQRAEKDLILAPSEEEMARYEDDIQLLQAALDSRVGGLRGVFGDTESEMRADVEQAYQDYVGANSQIRTVAGAKSDSQDYHFAEGIGGPIAAECEALLDELIDSNEEQMQQYLSSSQETYHTARSTLLGISVAGILISVAISFSTGHRIARRLRALAQYAADVQTTGDLSRPTPKLGRDEVGLLADAFDQMRSSLHEHTVSLSEQANRLEELTQTLEARNKEMEQFVYTVSHDLKSPLVSCKGLLGLLQEDVAERNYDAIVDSTRRLDTATDQLNQIIDDLLMLSRIGRKSLDLADVDVNGLVAELIDKLADRIDAAGAHVSVEGRLPSVLADTTDVTRVFENLLTNALKYGSGSAGTKITIGATDTGSESRFFVHDNGPGIEPKYHDRVFGLFQRLDTDQPGTGLGLASVAKIMSMHGGRAWVESEPGQGATFWVSFPHAPRPARK